MNQVIHKAHTRGHVNFGWLDSYHTFSFGKYNNPERLNFGALRVLNDDCVMGGQGFVNHPHNNMEIISIALEGDLGHKDSMGNVTVIKEGDVQIMNSGSGITHSEYNKNKDREVKFLQIWILPKERNITPKYDQIATRNISKANEFYQIVSPNTEDTGVWINQDAWFSLGEFQKGKLAEYKINKTGNGIYFFILTGTIEIEGKKLSNRDGFGIWDIKSVTVTAVTDACVLLMEVPMLF